MLDKKPFSEQIEYIEKAKVLAENIYGDPKACVNTYGCQQNVSDSEHFKGMLIAMGYTITENVIKPLFFNEQIKGVSPFYLYVNVTTPETLRKVLAEPENYAPSGVYIMRIHGTFVNFLDLSPEIQQDIIKRLDLKSTAIGS